MPKYKISLLLVTLVSLLAFVASCGGDGDSGGISGEISESENDERVGRKIVRCGVREVDEETVEELEGMLSSMRTARASEGSASARDAGTVVVPTFFHVIASGESAAEGNVPDAVLVEQIRILNESFAGTFGGANTAFRFELRGVSRNINPQLVALDFGSQVEALVKQTLRQGGPETLNIYLGLPSDGTLGYAYFPWDYASQPALDGVVVDFTTLPGGSLVPYNEGDTLTHEVGHWLGLFHTFQGECSRDNDLISDTPSEARPAFGCPTGRNTCQREQGPDPINNYMNYSDDFCLFEFTSEQSQRMDDLSVVFRGL